MATLRKFHNLLQHDNVLSIVIEFDTRRVLEPEKGSLFGVIAETVPIPRPGGFIGHPVPRIDWVGRPEQTNMRLNNPALAGTEDLRDLWNQQTPFAVSEALKPLFLDRLKLSFENWDLRDGKADWTPQALAANANVFLDDFLLIDVAKPTTDLSHLEIERSTLNGKPYTTGGGRTVDANVIDILLTWLVNRDREFMQGGATGGDQAGHQDLPLPGRAEHATAKRGRERRPRRAARQGLGADRRLRRQLASAGRQHPHHRQRRRAAAQHRNRSTASASSSGSMPSTTPSASTATATSAAFRRRTTAASSASSPRAAAARSNGARSSWPTASPTWSSG